MPYGTASQSDSPIPALHQKHQGHEFGGVLISGSKDVGFRHMADDASDNGAHGKQAERMAALYRMSDMEPGMIKQTFTIDTSM